jgi:hypothetical protein
MKRFNEFITEEISPIRMDDEEREEYERNRPMKYKIYTSADGIIEFNDNDLEPFGDEADTYFFNLKFKDQFDSFSNKQEVKVDLDRMFVFIETANGDFAEYKIFTN